MEDRIDIACVKEVLFFSTRSERGKLDTPAHYISP